MAPTSSGYVASNVNMFEKLMDTLPFSPPAMSFDIFNVTSSTVAVVTTAGPSPTQIAYGVSAEPTEDYVVLPGPEDTLLFNSSNGLYQQSVTLTARMYPIEATAAKSIWGLPTLIWGILIGTIAILIVILATLFFCCWLQPRTRKLLSASYYATTGSNVSHPSIVPKSQTSDSNQLVMPLSIGICPPQYSAPPPPGSSNSNSGNSSGTNQQQQQHQICSAGSSSTGGIPCHGSNVSPAAVHHGGSQKYGSSPHQQQQYAHQQQYHQQQQYQHHHQCIHHQQQQQQQQQQYQAHYAHLQQQQQQSYQQYYNQQQQQHQQQQQLTQYMHPAQQQALQQQQREHQIQQQQTQHHYHHQQHHHQQQQPQPKQQKQQLVHHKSMWAINPLYASSGVISDGLSGGGGGGGGGFGADGSRGDVDEDAVGGSTSYRTRSLPSWGKNKQRPLSNADDLEELYAKVNFSKKRRNRMRNDEAAIIALCRSRSQNLASLPMTSDQDAVVVYDERTAL